jgi:soluble lytic murein transglycosylase-like protein
MDSSVHSVRTGDRIWRVAARTDTIASMRGPWCIVLGLGLGLWLLSSSLPGVAAADIYRYVDGDGVEHYTNIQPKARGWQRVLRTGNATAAARAANRGRSGQGSDAERARRYDAHIREAALLYVLPEEFIRAVMRVESNFYPECVSHKGAMGLMQLMPATATSMGVLDPFDARQNVLGGARFLRVLANNFGGDLVLTIAAYNAGEGAVRRYGGIPPYAETRRYVQRVLTHYYAFRVASGENRALAKR